MGYKPTTGTDRTASFTLKNNVGIYGGFAGTETARNQRNIATNVTILSGEIGVAGIADNVYHVVSATGNISNPLTNSAILDGFTITGGNANGTTGNQGNGGGVYVSGASPTLRNITFRDNNGTNGGALYNESGSNPVLIDTLFEYNPHSAPSTVTLKILSKSSKRLPALNYRLICLPSRLTISPKNLIALIPNY